MALVLCVGLAVGLASPAVALLASGIAALAVRTLIPAVPRIALATACGACLGGVVAATTPLAWWAGLLVVPVVCFFPPAGCARGVPHGRSDLRRLLGRRPGPAALIVGLVTAGAGTAALLAYFARNATFVFAAAAPTGVALVGLALLNAVVEEGVWRGACLSVAMRSGLRPAVGVLVQASSFGLAHLIGGFPAGWVGVALTGAFGVTQGYLTLRTGSIALPVLVHAWLDVVIGSAVLRG